MKTALKMLALCAIVLFSSCTDFWEDVNPRGLKPSKEVMPGDGGGEDDPCEGDCDP